MTISRSYLNFPISLHFLSFLTPKEVAVLSTVSFGERVRLINLLIAEDVIQTLGALEIKSANFPDRHGFFSKHNIFPGNPEYYQAIQSLWLSLRWVTCQTNEIMKKVLKNEPHWYLSYFPDNEIQRLQKEKNPYVLEIKATSMMTRFFKIGNCGQLAATAFDFVKSKYRNAQVSMWQIQRKNLQNANHVFVVLGQGLAAIICDPWAGRAYPLQFATSCLNNTATFDFYTVLLKYNKLLDTSTRLA